MEELNQKIEKVQDDVDGKFERLYEMLDQKFKYVNKSFDTKFQEFVTKVEETQNNFQLTGATVKKEEEANEKQQ